MTLLTPPWKPGALLIRSDVMHGLGAYRHIEQQVWEHDIRLAERDVPIELLEEDLAVWNVESDPSAHLQRDLFPSGVRETFLKQHLDRAVAESLTRGPVASSENQTMLLAALLLFNDDLDQSHTILPVLR